MEEPQNKKNIIFLFALNTTMKDVYYLIPYQINSFQTFVTLILHYLCKVLLEGSIDASYDENTSILDAVFKYIDIYFLFFILFFVFVLPYLCVGVVAPTWLRIIKHEMA